MPIFNLVLRLINLMKRSHTPPDDLTELLAEQQRLDDIALWAKTEQLELSFRAGYWAGRCGIPERAAWEMSVVKAIRDAKRQELVRPFNL
jgi:hypothetical protein